MRLHNCILLHPGGQLMEGLCSCRIVIEIVFWVLTWLTSCGYKNMKVHTAGLICMFLLLQEDVTEDDCGGKCFWMWLILIQCVPSLGCCCAS